MGRSNSKLPTPTSPLEELQLQEIRREQHKRDKEKRLKSLQKLQKTQAKRRKNHRNNILDNNNQTTINTDYQLSTVRKEDYELQIEKKLQNQLNNDLCSFTLNQISLSLQFFGNYESEMTTANELILKNDNDLTQKLEDHSIFLAHSLDVAVAKRVQFKRTHGPDKNLIQPLQGQTMYVVFENIDVVRPSEANYDSISAICKVDMETDFHKPHKCNQELSNFMKDVKWKGYVRLKLRNNQTIPTIAKPVVQSTLSNRIVTENSSVTDSDYAYITHLNTPQPLTNLTMPSKANEKEEQIIVAEKILPDFCISDLANYIDESNDDDDDNDDDTATDDEVEKSVYKHSSSSTEELLELPKVLYLNSQGFMRYFGDLLKQKLSSKLHLSEKEFQNATYRGASIYTKNYEIIPAIHVAHNAQNWPDCMFQFRRRERPVAFNPITGQQFQWPTQAMMKRIESFGFHVIPVGFAPKKIKNPYRELEWKIVFPKAERFLESQLTNTQIKVFMIAKALIKTFVEPQEKENSFTFTVHHLRMHLFWECERNFSTWPEEFLGEVLLRFLKSFMSCLRHKQLPDFFIEERNLLECIPEYSLIRIYTTIAEIIENPLMHVMVAFRNLYFVDEFLPKINFKKIFSNLTESDYIKLKALSKNAKHNIVWMEEDDSRQSLYMFSPSVPPATVEDQKFHGLIVSQKYDKIKGPAAVRRRTLIKKRNIEQNKKIENEQNRNSVESIDVEYFFNQNPSDSDGLHSVNIGIENLRRTNILEIVLDNLIATAGKAVEYHSIGLARIYLTQAKRLCTLYSNYGCDIGAKEYMFSIESIKSELRQTTYSPPALPRRSSFEPIKKPEQVIIDETNSISKETHQSMNNLYITQISKPNYSSRRILSNVPRRSIKFTEDVVTDTNRKFNIEAQIHGHNAVNILRSAKQNNKINDFDILPRKSILLESKKFGLANSTPAILSSTENDYSTGKSLEIKPARVHEMLRKIKIDLNQNTEQTTMV